MKTLTQKDCQALFLAWDKTMQDAREMLIQMDQQVGDGDLGITMNLAFKAAAQTVSEQSDNVPIGKMFALAGMSMAKAAPSTMGSLMATGFMRGGKAILPDVTSLDTPHLADFFSQFVEGIMERGKAKPGDKTIVDALLPAAISLQESGKAGLALPEALILASQAAEAGIEATRQMKPQHGKAAVFQEKSVGLPDAGATVAGLLFKTLAAFVTR